ncbi:MAG: hypothetical protein JO356_10540 [Acidobacteria bacterium]|nr:hypothetical protein [Acidobacteriota bacterium]
MATRLKHGKEHNFPFLNLAHCLANVNPQNYGPSCGQATDAQQETVVP